MFIIWGWGRQSKLWEIIVEGITKQLACEYTYFSIFFIFKIVFTQKWVLMGENRSEDKVLTYKEVKQLLPEKTPKLSIWTRFGILITLALLILSIIIAGVTGNLDSDAPAIQQNDAITQSAIDEVNKEIALKQSIFPKYQTQYAKNKAAFEEQTEFKTFSLNQYYQIALQVKEIATLSQDGKSKTLKYGDSKYFVITVSIVDGKEIIDNLIISPTPTI